MMSRLDRSGTAVRVMDSFDETAFCLLIWRALLVALVSVVLVLTQPLTLVPALLVAANIALLFSLVLMACATRLTEERIARSEAWRLLPPHNRPRGVGGRRWACNRLKEHMLRFAKGSSIVAIVSSASALMIASE
jgi:hypothetical protein